MTLFDEGRGMIERPSPEPVPEECTAERLPPSVTGQVISKAHELTSANGFVRVFERFFAVRWTRYSELASVA